jgi:phytoene dehydrogenase-like protein
VTEPLADSYDVIIIGAGHNGLTAGTYLQRAGFKVLITDRLATPGGLSQASNIIPGAPNHIAHTATGELIHVRASPVLHELDLAGHGLTMVDTDPSYAYLDPEGGSIAIFRDPKRTAEDIARFSKADAAAYLEFVELIDALMAFGGAMGKGDPAIPSLGRYWDIAKVAVRNRRLKSKLQLIAAASAEQLAFEWFEHPTTQSFMLGFAGMPGPFDVDGNAIGYALLGLLHRIGVGKPVGGMQSLANAFAGAYAASGGALLLNVHVKDVLIEDGAMRGIVLADGRMIKARAVISTQDPKTAAAMISEGGLDRVTRARMEHAPSNQQNVGPSVINVASSNPILLKRHQDLRHDDADLNKATCLIGTAQESQAALKAARRGMVPIDPVFALSPMTNWDASLAPPGQGYAYLYMHVFPVDVNEGWDKLKAPAADAIIARASDYYSGFESELGRWFETCPERATRVNITNGAAGHVDFGSFRTGAKRPGFGIGGPGPLAPGFFLGGASIHPGPGVSGNAGRLVAGRVQNWLKWNAK